MSDIPAARAALMELIEDGLITGIAANRVRGIVRDLMLRERPIRKTEIRSAPLTELRAEAIRKYAAENPSLSMQQIANNFRVNPGRVSEAMNGLR